MLAQSKTAKGLRRAERSVVAALRQKICFWNKNKSKLHTVDIIYIWITPNA